MFDNVRPPSRSCPLDAETKDWLDARASWLVYQFGRERIASCRMILPTADFFPDPFLATEDGARQVLDTLCDVLRVESHLVDFSLFRQGESPTRKRAASAVYDKAVERYRICVDASQLDKPSAMAATMAHELGHVLLMGHGRLAEEADDREPLAELLTVFLGLGVLTANAAFHDRSWMSDGWDPWEIHRRGYFTMPMYGYALALFATLRHEERPAWAKHLRLDVRAAFKSSLRFFKKHGVPELRTLRTTSARPPIPLARGDEDDRQQDQRDLSVTECVFCAATLDGVSMSGGVCRECQVSIKENQLEIAAERRRTEIAQRRFATAVRWGGLALLVLVIVLAALEYIGGR
jgi:hypothetical protein